MGGNSWRSALAGRSIAVRLALISALFFGVLASVGGVVLYHMVKSYVQGELQGDIARQMDEFVHLLDQKNGMLALHDSFRAFEKSCSASTCFVRMTDDRGNVLAASDMAKWPDMPLPGPLLLGHPGKSSIFTVAPLPDRRHKVQLLSVFVPSHGYMQLGVSLQESELLFDHFRRYALAILFTMLSLGALIGLVLARQAMEGVEAVTRASRSVAAGHFSERVEVSGHGREIDDLVRSFNLMVERVQGVMGEMRQVNDNIAHDLRSPLTRIRGMAENAAINSDTQAERAWLAGDIVEECDHLMEMINTMLDISEAETGARRLQVETVDMNQLLVQATDLFVGVAEDKGIALEVRPASREAVLQGDRRRLQRVLANLIDNAIKYTPRGGRVTAKLEHEPGRICIEVRDTGIGIAAHDLPRIFERFYRCDRSRHKVGNGLGLSLAQAIAHAHGGGIAVSSRPGEGSVFSLILPV